MATNNQRRDAARRQLEQNLQQRAAHDAARRKTTLIASIAGTLALIVAVIVVVVLVGGKDSKTPAAAATTTPAAAGTAPATNSHSPLPSRSPAPIGNRAARTSTGACRYSESEAALRGNPNLFDVGLPPDPAAAPRTGPTVVFDTNRGPITALLDASGAPCNVQSLVYLIGKKFYDGTACPRSVNSGIYVVQCGDPTGSTSGGPSYTVKDENLANADYSAGTIAMANSGPDTNGSQFFFITKDSNGALGKNYTVVGHVTGGLSVLEQVAAGGDDGSNPAGGGRPNLDLVFTRVTVRS